ncbi:EscE/YscE/SsaE family type III secretion system needle protein co-chaperone [Kosakonia sp. BYX6]|uniref:EscE/YscE/SsaE family type III secretion system needle protein co-chaperone n=1 Tax=Kosakonia calanthes TaxID=3139408 RepID=A0ABZ3B4Q3_9ENTR
MATLTQLEDRLSLAESEAQAIIRQLKNARHRLEKINNPQLSQENTLLLQGLIQAEDIIKIIYYRYHNCRLQTDPE